jgi:hypothetical protein
LLKKPSLNEYSIPSNNSTTNESQSRVSVKRNVLNPEEEDCGINAGFELSPEDFLSEGEIS